MIFHFNHVLCVFNVCQLEFDSEAEFSKYVLNVCAVRAAVQGTSLPSVLGGFSAGQLSSRWLFDPQNGSCRGRRRGSASLGSLLPSEFTPAVPYTGRPLPPLLIVLLASALVKT